MLLARVMLCAVLVAVTVLVAFVLADAVLIGRESRGLPHVRGLPPIAACRSGLVHAQARDVHARNPAALKCPASECLAGNCGAGNRRARNLPAGECARNRRARNVPARIRRAWNRCARNRAAWNCWREMTLHAVVISRRRRVGGGPSSAGRPGAILVARWRARSDRTDRRRQVVVAALHRCHLGLSAGRRARGVLPSGRGVLRRAAGVGRVLRNAPARIGNLVRALAMGAMLKRAGAMGSALRHPASVGGMLLRALRVPAMLRRTWHVPAMLPGTPELPGGLGLSGTARLPRPAGRPEAARRRGLSGLRAEGASLNAARQRTPSRLCVRADVRGRR